MFGSKRKPALALMSSVALAALMSTVQAPSAQAVETSFRIAAQLPWSGEVYAVGTPPSAQAGVGTSQLNATVSTTCNAGKPIYNPQWLSLPQAQGDIVAVVRAQDWGTNHGVPEVRPSGFAFVDIATGAVLSCGGSVPGAAPSGTHAFVAYFGLDYSQCGYDPCGPSLEYQVYESAGTSQNNDWQHAAPIASLPFVGHANDRNTPGATAGAESCFFMSSEQLVGTPTAWWRFTATATGPPPAITTDAQEGVALNYAIAEATESGPRFIPDTNDGVGDNTDYLTGQRCVTPPIVAGKDYYIVVLKPSDPQWRPLLEGADFTLTVGDPIPARAPLAPHAFAVTNNIADGTVTMTWEPPLADGGSPVTGYRVYRSGTDRSGRYPDWSTVIPASARSFTFKYLKPWGNYYVDVAAVNAVDLTYARSVGVTAQAPVPSPPWELTTTAGSHRATVSWWASSYEGTSPILGYRIRRFLGDTKSEPEAISTVGPRTHSITMTQLTNGQRYRFEVVAFNASGEGSLSERTPFVVPQPVLPRS